MNTRYIGRREFFGSFLFDREINDYISFDKDETSLFQNGRVRNPVNLFEKRKFEEFGNICKKMLVTDENGKFLHKWIDSPAKEGMLSAPLKISLNITSGCNLACRHCYTEAKNVKGYEMNLENAKRLIDEMAEMGIQSLSVKGGEPFFHSQIMKILSYAAERGLLVTIITNATLIDEKIAEEINNYSVSYITVSIDGAQEKTNDYIRGVGSFKKIIRSVSLLKDRFTKPVYIYFTLNRMNKNEIEGMLKLTAEIGGKMLRIRPVIPLGRAEVDPDINLDAKDYREAIDEIIRLLPGSGIKVDLPHSEAMGLNENVSVNPGLYSFGCVAGNTFIHIDPYGNVYPCQYLETSEYLSGNIFSTSLKDVWMNSVVLERFRNLTGNKKCLDCEFFLGCRGGCRARSVILHNDIDSPDPWCKKSVKA